MQENKGVIIRFEDLTEQTVGDITKIVGLVQARFFVSIIDAFDLDANPRSAKKGTVTDEIQKTIAETPHFFPFMSKGVLLASSDYERLERGRWRLKPANPQIEGILDGGHNSLAIGLFILEQALNYQGQNLPNTVKTWTDFKMLWQQKRELIDGYMSAIQKEEIENNVDFLVPVELLVPRNTSDSKCVSSFTNNLLEICEARNNNAELQEATKVNKKGHFKDLQEALREHNPRLESRVEWKTNEGGDIKAQHIVALSWVVLNLVCPVKAENGSDRFVEAVAPNKLYSAKGTCMGQYEKFMSSPDVTQVAEDGYHHELINEEVRSAFRIAAELPDLYDYIYEYFPKYYNANGGHFQAIAACKKLNERRKVKVTPFNGKRVEMLSPDGFIMPLFYGLQILLAKRTVNGSTEIYWSQDPETFLNDHLEKIVADYMGNLNLCDYDPQKVGKAPKIYDDAIKAFKMAIAGIL